MKHKRRRTKLSGRGIVKLAVILLLTGVLIAAAVIFLRNKVREEFASEDASGIIQSSVTVGSISTSVYGSGLLSDDDVEKLLIPDGVELEKIYVRAGDSVAVGDVLAVADTSSAMSAMISLSEEIKTLDSQINTASGSAVENFITAPVYGRVKAIYVEPGDSVMDVMLEKGALMLLSLDGYMAVDIPAGALKADDAVSVLSSAGYRYSGAVDRIMGDTATVLVSDDGTAYGDSVTVTDFQGKELGSGTLYIHDPLKVIGYSGTVNFVYVPENRVVFSGTALMELVGNEGSLEMEALLVQRAELEAELEKLMEIYSEGLIYAPFGGTVMELTATEADEETESSEEGETVTERYISISPDKSMSVSVGVDESDILSVSVGQQAVVSINSLDGEEFSGTVTGIDRAGTSTDGVTSYTATVSVKKESGMLSGMSASTTISIEGVDNALLVPVDAVNRTSTVYYVYTAYDEATNTLSGMKEVTVGISNANYTEIKSGLNEGDVIYYEEREESMDFFMPGGRGPGDGGMGFGGNPGRENMPGGMPGGNAGGMGRQGAAG